MKSTPEILEILRLYKQVNARKYGFNRLGIFGSVARGNKRNIAMSIFVTKVMHLLFLR